jgi:hypothetical protein
MGAKIIDRGRGPEPEVQAKLARSRQKLQAKLAEIRARHQDEDTHASDHGGS